MNRHVRFNLSGEFKTAEGCHILELLNTPEDNSCSITRARVEPGVTTKLHSVRDTIERYVFLQGEGSIEIAGERITEVKPLDVIYVAPGETQRVSNTGTSDLVFLAVCTPRFRPEAYVIQES